MAIQINSQVTDSTKVYKITVTLTSIDAIPDPVDYVSQPKVWLEILAIAGLPQLLYVGAQLIDEGYIGLERFYVLVVTFDQTQVTATGHMHDSSTLFHPLREAYRDGPYIDLTSSLGPVDIWSPTADAVDYLRVRLFGGDDYLLVTKDGRTVYGGHQSFIRDAEFDIGSPDAGATLRRPRDLYLAEDLWAGGNVEADGHGYFGEGVLGTHYLFTQQPSNPDPSPTSRLIYWNSTDNTLRGWDGSVEFIIGGGTTALTGIVAIYGCGPAVSIGDAVSIIGNNFVDKADAALLGLRPVIGIVVNKPDSTHATVQLGGEVGVFGGSLIPNTLYFLGHVPGSVVPEANLSGFNIGDTVQLIGVSKTDSILTLRFESRVLL